MSEGSQSEVLFNKHAEIAEEPQRSSRWDFLNKTKGKLAGWKAIGQWAIGAVRSRTIKRRNPEQTRENLLNLRAQLDSAPPTTESAGNITPQPPSTSASK